MWPLYVVVGTALAAAGLWKLAQPFPEFAAHQALRNGDTVQVPARALGIADAFLVQHSLDFSALNEFDALRALIANAGPETLIRLTNVTLIGEGPLTLDNSMAKGKSTVFPRQLSFKRDEVRVIERGSRIMKFIGRKADGTF